MTSSIIGGIGISHAPSLMSACNPAHPYYQACERVASWVRARSPDLIVVFASDHLDTVNYFQMPGLAIGVADEFPQIEQDYTESDSQIRARTSVVKGSAELAWPLAEALVEAQFDLALCQDLAVDHAIVNGLAMATGGLPSVPIVPILINSYLAPMPTPRRCFALGKAVREAIRSLGGDRRVLVLSTGGLSHNLNGPSFGFVNEEWDVRFLRILCEEPDTLAALTNSAWADRCGDAGMEGRSWLAMRGALGSTVRSLESAYFNPSITGLGLLCIEEVAP